MERYVDFDKQDMEATIDLRSIVGSLFPCGYDLTNEQVTGLRRTGDRTRLNVHVWPRGFGFLGPDEEALYAATAYRWWLLAGPGAYKSPREQIIQHVTAKFGPARAVYRAAKLHAATIGWFSTAMSLYNDAPKIVLKPLTRLNRVAVFNLMYDLDSYGQIDRHWCARPVMKMVMKAAFNPGLAKYLNDGGIL